MFVVPAMCFTRIFMAGNFALSSAMALLTAYLELRPLLNALVAASASESTRTFPPYPGTKKQHIAFVIACGSAHVDFFARPRCASGHLACRVVTDPVPSSSRAAPHPHADASTTIANACTKPSVGAGRHLFAAASAVHSFRTFHLDGGIAYLLSSKSGSLFNSRQTSEYSLSM